MTPDTTHITDAMVEAVEDALGRAHRGWDESDPKEIVAAARAPLEAERAALPRKLAAALWEVSTLRHGLFTPPQFQQICEEVIARALAVGKYSPP